MIREIHFGTLMPTLNGYSGDKKIRYGNLSN